MKYKRICASALLATSLLFAPLSAQANPDTYTVVPGDSMWKIAVRYEIGLSEIIEANPHIRDPRWIYPGDRLTIPNLDALKQLEHEVIRLTNAQRAKYGLPALRSNWELSRVARLKSNDMRDKHYFSHTSPTYGSPFTMIKSFGISYSSAAENIAAGQATPQAVVDSWMKSPGHRANILSKNVTVIGVGFSKGGSYGYYWTQMFIKP